MTLDFSAASVKKLGKWYYVPDFTFVLAGACLCGIACVRPASRTTAWTRAPPAPLFRDPVFDGAADPSLIWNDRERAWWIFYTNRRANAPDAQDGVRWCHGTDLGIASSADGGLTWTYRGTAKGLEFEPGRNTFWAPCLLEHGRTYHMFVAYVRGVPADWSGDRHIVHYTSRDLENWKFEAIVPLSSERVIDAFVYAKPSGGWRMWYKDEANGSHIYAADSEDLYRWSVVGPVVTDKAQEGAAVFWWQGSYWMLVDRWQGMGCPAIEPTSRLGPSSRAPFSAFRESVPTTAISAATARSSFRALRPIFSISPIPSGPRRTRSRASTARRSRSPASSSGTGGSSATATRRSRSSSARRADSSRRKRPESALELETPDAQLAAAFAWAKAQALDYVFPAAAYGDPVGDWYEAALPSRFAFCMRDVSHQATGAQALGLAAFNRNMLGKFARAIGPSRDYLLLLGDRQVGPAGPGRLQERQGFLVQPAGQFRRPRRLLAPIPLDGRQDLYRGPGFPRVLSPDGQGLYRGLGQGRRRHPRASPGIRQPRARRLRRGAVLGSDGLRRRPHRPRGPGLRFLRRDLRSPRRGRQRRPGRSASARPRCAAATRPSGGTSRAANTPTSPSRAARRPSRTSSGAGSSRSISA